MENFESIDAVLTINEALESAALENATTNAEYESAEAALKTAIENLEIETDPGDGDGGTTDPGDGDGGTSDPGDGDGGTTEPGDTDGGTTEPGDSDSSEELPTTGSQTFAPYAFVMTLLGAIILIVKKRQEDK